MLRNRRWFRYILLLLILAFIHEIWMRLFETTWEISGHRLPLPVKLYFNYSLTSTLMNLTEFKYLINPTICESGEDILAVILVHTHPSHISLRDTTRNKVPTTLLRDLGFRRVFLIGQAVSNQTNYPAVNQNIMDMESDLHKDMVQGNFIEHYRNLTYKHIMGLSWVTQECPQAKFVIKMDDDIAVDIFQIKQLLKYKYYETKNHMFGLIQIEAHPQRTAQSKWMVTKDEYQANVYPPFLSGWCYFATLDAVSKIIAQAHKFPYFWIDDVFVTGIVADTVHVEREGINNKYTIHSAHLRCCSEPSYSPSQYYCDFIAGPTNGDTYLLGKSLDQFRSCYERGCTRRPWDMLIVRRCVNTAPQLPPGPGVGEVIAL